jgi:hypothetical protein
MEAQPCKPALRIAARIAEETGCGAEVQQQIAELVHEQIKDYRPLDAFAQSLKEVINRIIEGGEPELKAIAASIGISVLTK